MQLAAVVAFLLLLQLSWCCHRRYVYSFIERYRAIFDDEAALTRRELVLVGVVYVGNVTVVGIVGVGLSVVYGDGAVEGGKSDAGCGGVIGGGRSGVTVAEVVVPIVNSRRILSE